MQVRYLLSERKALLVLPAFVANKAGMERAAGTNDPAVLEAWAKNLTQDIARGMNAFHFYSVDHVLV